MTCINCRNPLSENSSICEWCGNDNSKPNIQTPNIDKEKKANKKALKYTLYLVLFLLCIINLITMKLGDFQIFYIIAPTVIIYEFYLHLVRKFQK